MPTGFVWRPTGVHDVRAAAAAGLLNTLLNGENEVKKISVVRGGNRSFLTGSHLGGPLGIVDPAGTRRGKVKAGGTLRRAWHAVVYLDGAPVAGSTVMTENQQSIPAYPTGGSPIVGIIGNNAGYSFWVDQGTGKMPARPMLMPALQAMVAALAGTFRAGWMKYASRRP